jgi:hypothetical protein
LTRMCFPSSRRGSFDEEQEDEAVFSSPEHPPAKTTRPKVVGGCGLTRAEKLREMFSGRRSYRQAEYVEYF